MVSSSGYIVVTGGAGFIGSGLIRHLNEQGTDQIVVVDRLGTTEKWRNLVGKRFALLMDKSELFDWLDSSPGAIAAFFHLGACSSTVETDASYLLDNNYRYSQRLAKYAAHYGIPFLYASSAATYGDGALGFCDDEAELQSLRPLNMYGFSKQLFDLWLQREGLLRHFIGCKFFNVFGPNEQHKGRMASAALHFLRQLQQEGRLRLFASTVADQFGDGEQCRDFIYVKDAVRITAALLEKGVGGIYNVGSGIASSWNRLANALFSAMGQTPQIDYVAMPEDLRGKYQNYTCADMEKTHRSLGAIAHSRSLEEAIADYLHHHLLLDQLW